MSPLPSGSSEREESRPDSRSLPTEVEGLDRQESAGRSRGRGSHDTDRYPLRKSRRRERESRGDVDSDPPVGVEIHQIKVAGAAGFLAPLVLFGPFPFLSDMALLTFSLSVPTLCVIGAVYAALRPRPWIASGALLGGFLLGTVLVSMALQAIRH